MNRNTTALLAAVLIFAAVFTVIIYSYPTFNTITGSNTNQSVGRVVQANQAALLGFLGKYGFDSNTSLSAYYQVPANNEMIINCNYGVEPSYYNIPPLVALENFTAYKEYTNITTDVGKYTLCVIDPGLPGCTTITGVIYNFTMKFMNYSTAYSLYNSTASTLYRAYNSVKSIPEAEANSTFFGPLYYDISVLNSTNESLQSSMVKSLIKLEQIPEYILDLKNGTVETDPIYLPVPFQYEIYYYPLRATCNSSLVVFNLISSLSNFATQTYYNIYTGLGADVTNICINDSSNSCKQSELNTLNISFYAQR